MALQYRKFNLTPGQQPPSKGSTGKCLTDGSIVWYDEETLWVWNTLNNSVMTAAEINQYLASVEFDSFEQPEQITFDEYCDSAKFDVKKKAIIDLLNTQTSTAIVLTP